MSVPKVDLIRQALTAAESSMKLARQLLGDIEKEGFKNKPKAKELPGMVGMFDGQGMITEAGEKFPVPENYASKSILVVGDTLKLVQDGGEKRFKQIEHVKRHKTTGILAKKDGKWAAVSSEGSYRVLPASVAHFEGDIGDEALLQLPANNLQVPWAAVERISKKGAKGPENVKVTEETKETKETKVTEEKKEAEPVKKETKEEGKAEDKKGTKETEGTKATKEKEKVEGKKIATAETQKLEKKTATIEGKEIKNENTELKKTSDSMVAREATKGAATTEVQKPATIEAPKESEAPKETESPKEEPKSESDSEDELA